MLAWVLGQQPESPITHVRLDELTTRDLKAERLGAEDVIEQASQSWMADRLALLRYGEGVKLTITWLLGDSTARPIDSPGDGFWRGRLLTSVFDTASARRGE
jgi:hypothetical protein